MCDSHQYGLHTWRDPRENVNWNREERFWPRFVEKAIEKLKMTVKRLKAMRARLHAGLSGRPGLPTHLTSLNLNTYLKHTLQRQSHCPVQART